MRVDIFCAFPLDRLISSNKERAFVTWISDGLIASQDVDGFSYSRLTDAVPLSLWASDISFWSSSSSSRLDAVLCSLFSRRSCEFYSCLIDEDSREISPRNWIHSLCLSLSALINCLCVVDNCVLATVNDDGYVTVTMHRWSTPVSRRSVLLKLWDYRRALLTTR